MTVCSVIDFSDPCADAQRCTAASQKRSLVLLRLGRLGDGGSANLIALQ